MDTFDRMITCTAAVNKLQDIISFHQKREHKLLCNRPFLSEIEITP